MTYDNRILTFTVTFTLACIPVAHQTSPDVLLIDEALSVGDAKFRDKSRAVMEEWVLSDKTVVIVSHNDQTITELCDRVIWLDGGKIIQMGDTEQIVSAYSRA